MWGGEELEPHSTGMFENGMPSQLALFGTAFSTTHPTQPLLLHYHLPSLLHKRRSGGRKEEEGSVFRGYVFINMASLWVTGRKETIGQIPLYSETCLLSSHLPSPPCCCPLMS